MRGSGLEPHCQAPGPQHGPVGVTEPNKETRFSLQLINYRAAPMKLYFKFDLIQLEKCLTLGC